MQELELVNEVAIAPVKPQYLEPPGLHMISCIIIILKGMSVPVQDASAYLCCICYLLLTSDPIDQVTVNNT